MTRPEAMTDFFHARLSGYESHMLEEVEGCREAYRLVAELLPEDLSTLLDLGTGTGLELEPIFDRFPSLAVNAIDLSGPMLSRLREKFPEKALCLIAGDFRRVNLGIPLFGAAVSVQAMHHLTREEKAALYPRILGALVREGVYIQADYTASSEAEAERLLAEATAARQEYGIPPEEPVHLDIPLTAEAEIALLKEAGFTSVEPVFSKGNTTVLVAKKA